jgi:outer membrane receptor protein involved in Fe transport
VLIDGDRPSTKSENLETVLSRIPVSQIERIELIEQAGADGETSGQGQVVNIIRKSGNALSGTYEGHFTVGPKYGFVAFANGSATLKRGKTTYEFNLGSFDDDVRGEGPERFFDGSRRLIETRTYEGFGGYTEIAGGASVKTQIGDAKLNVNAKASWNNGTDRRFGVYTGPTNAVIGSERLFVDEPLSDLDWEAGADLEFRMAPKLNTKIVGLYRTGHDSASSFIETIRPGQATTLFRADNRNRPSEAIGRIQNDWSGLANQTIQFGAELAYNRLDARFLGESAIGAAPSNFSRSNVLVEESRIEPFVSNVWTASPSWKIESGAIFEFSKLRLSGDSTARRSFQFAKPRLTATWTASKSTTFEFKAVHQVAQLNFEEFATSVDLGQGGQVDSGNDDLVPEKVTTFSALVRHKFMDRGSIQLETSYEMLRDTQDLVPVSDGQGGFFDGAGNIGKGRRWNAELEIKLPLDWLTTPIGVSGIEVKYVGHYHGSRVTDPVTGLKRRVSFRPEYHQSWELRHDIPKIGIAWGLDVRTSAPGNAYFVNLERWQLESPQYDAFLEYKKFKLGTVRLKVSGIGGQPFRRIRFGYAGTRASGIVNSIIDRTRKLDPRFQLSLIGKF